VVFHPDVLGDKSTNVDDSQKIGLVWLDLPGVVSGFVEQHVGWDWFSTGWVESAQEVWSQIIGVVVVVFSQSQDNLFVVVIWEIIVFNDKHTSHTITVLTRSMGVVPVSTDLAFDGKVVQESFTWWDRTLGDHFWTIHLIATRLEHTMEMQGSVSVVKTVVQVQLDSVTFLDPQGWQWPGVVETNHFSLVDTIWVGVDPSSSEPPCVSFCRNDRNQGENEQKD
jgi:hypothetical protein